MTGSFTAKYVKVDNGYYGQVIEWPEVITEGTTLEECRLMLLDALSEMAKAYNELGKETWKCNIRTDTIGITNVRKAKRVTKVS